MLEFGFTFLLLGVGIVLGRPSEQPIKFDLSPARDAVGSVSDGTFSKLQQGQEFLGQVADAIRFGRGRLVHSATMAKNIIAERAEQAASEAQNNVASVIAAKGDLIAQGRSALETFPKTGFFNILPPITRETVHLESSKNQALLEKPVMGPVAGFIESILRPTPLVDKIKESDKYGNSGERFAGIGKAIVDGYEGFSNFLNTVVDFPVDAAKKTSRKITETLNQFGAHLVGLA
ncbi:uncharacterized protein LOC105690137 isoform X1 [Athalia rosae]|uniref:uncharacterized protein LOC105690137 isoform X1 n=1 Tax=Athalia rosae TaxID=37344 RepID=UPI0020346945|nr:uncharacterized protein LOC105690137 isoform X1 [Athalia rosae]XP_048512074.1 uncharacterized protein LOC105690137 isoform X1 [Athalia rosae]XP_048512075.1 uncharacterized protein LOC105690137 isoform X1 [Athalia rosae]XP_048512076.1 uncharacterized protein LOC105690137 isoform X1 [Athalia rosae]